MKPVQITLKKIAQPKSPAVPVQVGGGYISPSVARHLRQSASSAK